MCHWHSTHRPPVPSGRKYTPLGSTTSGACTIAGSSGTCATKTQRFRGRTGKSRTPAIAAITLDQAPAAFTTVPQPMDRTSPVASFTQFTASIVGTVLCAAVVCKEDTVAGMKRTPASVHLDLNADSTSHGSMKPSSAVPAFVHSDNRHPRRVRHGKQQVAATWSCVPRAPRATPSVLSHGYFSLSCAGFNSEILAPTALKQGDKVTTDAETKRRNNRPAAERQDVKRVAYICVAWFAVSVSTPLGDARNR